MKRFLFWTTYLIPVLILSVCWLLYQEARDLVHSYFDWVVRDYEN